MRRILVTAFVACALLVPSVAWSIHPDDRWPSTSSGSGSDIEQFCANGGIKQGCDDTGRNCTDTCFNYPWGENASLTYSGAVECQDDPTADRLGLVECTGFGVPDVACTSAGEWAMPDCLQHRWAYAQDYLRPGGTMHIIKPSGAIGVSYPYRGCTNTTCPTINQNWSSDYTPVWKEKDQPYDIHKPQVLKNRKVQCHAHIDASGEEDGVRQGIWLLNDSGNAGTVDADGSTAISLWTFATGPWEFSERKCNTPDASGNCDLDAITGGISRMVTGLWGQSLELTRGITRASGVAGGMQLCVSDVTTTTGFCSGDKRIQCTTAVDPCAAASSGTCLSSGAAVADDLSKGRPVYMAFEYQAQNEFGEVNAQNPQIIYHRAVAAQAAIGGTSCAGLANTDIVFLGPMRTPEGAFSVGSWTWPGAYPEAATTSHLINAYVADWDQIVQTLTPNFLPGCTIAANDWYGRSTCLSNNTRGSGDDEAACDQGPVTGGGGFGGGFDGTAFLHASAAVNSAFEMNTATLARMTNSYFAFGRRGQINDGHHPMLDGSIFYSNNLGNFTLLGLFQWARVVENVRFMNNRASGAWSCKQGMVNSVVRNNFSSGNEWDDAWGSMGNCSTTHVYDNVIRGDYGRFISHQGATSAAAHLPMGNVIENNTVHMETVEVTSGFVRQPKALFHFGDGQGTGHPGVHSIRIDNNSFYTASNDSCLVYFDDTGAGGSASEFTQQDDFAHEVSITNNFVHMRDEGNNWRVVCIGDDNNSGERLASTAPLHLFGQTKRPYVEGNRFLKSYGNCSVTTGTLCVNDVDCPATETCTNFRSEETLMEEHPFHMHRAAATPDCNNALRQTVVAIYDDTAIAACTDAGPDGQLDGGGTAASYCVCDGAGAWSSYLP